MKKHSLFLSTLVATTFYAGEACAESACYVQSVNARILSEPSFKSKVIAEVGMGQMLTLTSKDGSWAKVTFGDKQGYMSSLLLSAHPPLQKVEIIRAEDSEIQQGVRRRTSSFASAAAARGLTKDDRQRADIEDKVDYDTLKKMESMTIGDDEVAQFVKGEKL